MIDVREQLDHVPLRVVHHRDEEARAARLHVVGDAALLQVGEDRVGVRRDLHRDVAVGGRVGLRGHLAEDAACLELMSLNVILSLKRGRRVSAMPRISRAGWVKPRLI